MSLASALAQHSNFRDVIGELAHQVCSKVEKARKKLAVRREQKKERLIEEALQYTAARKQLEAARQNFAALFWKIYEEYEPNNKEPVHCMFTMVMGLTIVIVNEITILDLSRFRAAPSARLGHFPFEGDRAFPAQC